MSTNAVRLTDRLPKGYPRLFAAGLINGIGDRFSSVAMLALVLQITGSGMAVGISLGVRVLPFLFMAPLGGLLAGRLPRRSIMIAVDLIRVPVAVSFLWIDGESMLWLLYAGSFIPAAGEAVYSPVRKSSIPLLADSGSLHRINSLEQLMNGCVLILGAFIGGIVSLWLGPEAAFMVNAASFLIAALLLWGMAIPQTAVSAAGRITQEKAANEPAIRTGHRKGQLQTLKYAAGGSLILQIIIGYELIVPVLNGWDNVLISVYAVQVFHAGDFGVGAFYAALGIGLSLSFFAGRLLKKRLLTAALAGLMTEGILLMVLSGSSSFAAACLLYVLLSVSGGISSACLDTLVMREAPPALQPLIFGFLSAAGGLLLGVSMLSAGWLLEYIDPRTLGFAGGAGFAGVSLLLGSYYLLRRSAVRRTPEKLPHH
ncbi:MFS transporter [Paenibacillus sp. PK3_47]|uniref:MFS transporter n=1 Tax=Paenibacillus sp. PK3_47 TaxID=2072642 RepID=UPI00201D9C6E|nr:MFS transporter [Paenibacillus sp. PK3_47]UQZ34747.1 MFS transporter [Paenibacillus sp. PK3_47]